MTDEIDPSRSLRTLGGSLLIGLTISLHQYGVTTAQTVFYFRTYGADQISLKIRVGMLWALYTLYVALIANSVYENLIIKSRAGSAVAAVYTWSMLLTASFVLNLFIVFVIHIHFISKIHKLNSTKWKLWVSSLLVVSVVARAACGIVIAFLLGPKFSSSDVHVDAPVIHDSGNLIVCLIVPLEIHGLLSQSRASQEAATIIFVAITLLADFIISVALCLLIHPRHIRLISSRTQYAVTRLTMMASRRCIVVCILSIIELGFVLSHTSIRSQATFFGLECTMAGVYFDSFMLNVNARHTMRYGDETESAHYTIQLELAEGGEFDGSGGSPQSGDTAPRVVSRKPKLKWHEVKMCKTNIALKINTNRGIDYDHPGARWILKNRDIEVILAFVGILIIVALSFLVVLIFVFGVITLDVVLILVWRDWSPFLPSIRLEQWVLPEIDSGAGIIWRHDYKRRCQRKSLRANAPRSPAQSPA
ncbi:hypothetical protein NM688_g3682 [Phlebia brevispora]|uniref:Uncharacterized protein n=1 Tax=Phlebia brevispora TaxID=194682 RepID=A0ACC1T571_9APHY|nr:hypothetical protein NM688_g3682 [Phlebia brevispora]